MAWKLRNFLLLLCNCALSKLVHQTLKFNGLSKMFSCVLMKALFCSVFISLFLLFYFFEVENVCASRGGEEGQS